MVSSVAVASGGSALSSAAQVALAISVLAAQSLLNCARIDSVARGRPQKNRPCSFFKCPRRNLPRYIKSKAPDFVNPRPSPRAPAPALIHPSLVWQVGWVNLLAAALHTATIVLVVVAVLTLAPSLNAWSVVWSSYDNYSGFAWGPYVVATGLTSSLFVFSGYECSAHVAEETVNAAVEAPAGLVRTVAATVGGGVALLLALLLATTDVAAALGESDDDGR